MRGSPMADRENFHQSLLREHQRYQSRRWFFKRVRRRPGRDRARHRCSASAALRPRRRAATRWRRSSRTSRRRPSASSTCSWPARRATSSCSTTSRELAKCDGKLPPAELLKGYRAAFINPNSKLLGPKFKFAKHGKCGAELSELLPHLATVVDDIAIVKSMATDAFNHAPARS